jgi:Ricin-type beta-trefoil lectin domain
MGSRAVTAVLVSAAALLAGTLSSAAVSAATVGGGGSAVAARPSASAVQTAAVKAAEKLAKTKSFQAADLPDLVSQTPLTYTPLVNGDKYSCGKLCEHPTVYDTAIVGGEVVVAGSFNETCSPVKSAVFAECPTQAPVAYVFAFNIATGALDQSFMPQLNNGPVNALAAGPNDTVYVGGRFTSVDGQTADGLAQLYVTPGVTATDGQPVPGFSAQVNGTVDTLATDDNNALYVGGSFAATVPGVKVSKQQRDIVRLNATTGQFDPTFSFTVSDPIDRDGLAIETIALSPDASTLAIGGTLQEVDGQFTPRIALLSTGGGLGETASLDNWSAPILGNNCSAEHDYIEQIAFSPDSTWIAVGTTGYESAGGASICDSVARFETAPVGNDVQPVWTDYTGGDTIRSVLVSGNVLYVGGHNRWLNNVCGNNAPCEQNAVLVDGLAAVDPNTGLALPFWHPQTSRGVGLDTMTTFGPGVVPGLAGGLIVGTDVNIIGGQTRDKLAIFPLTSTAAYTPGGPIQSGVFANGRYGGYDESTQGTPAECIDDPGNATTPGTTVDLATCNNSNEQNWTIGSDGTIVVNGLCLDTNQGQTSVGTQLVLNTCDSASSQVWTQSTGNTLINQASGLCADDPAQSGQAPANGSSLELNTCNGSQTQVWPLPVSQGPPSPPATGTFYSLLQLRDQVPCVDDLANSKKAGAAVVIYTCLGYTAQNWTMEPNGTFVVNGLCMDTAGEATSQGTQVVLNTCNGSATQQWTLDPPNGYSSGGDGSFLVNQAAQMCLDVPGANPAQDSHLQIWQCNGGGNQQWRVPQI